MPVLFVPKSGGVSRAEQHPLPRCPSSAFISHVLRYEQGPQYKMLVPPQRVGIEEYQYRGIEAK